MTWQFEGREAPGRRPREILQTPKTIAVLSHFQGFFAPKLSKDTNGHLDFSAC